MELYKSRLRRPESLTPYQHLYPKIDLSACRSCAGNGYRLINGVRWNCFSCAGSGTIVQHGGRVIA